MAAWEAWEAWEPPGLAGPTERASSSLYPVHAPSLDSVTDGSWGVWNAHAEETTSSFDPTEEATTSYTQPPAALFDPAGLGAVVSGSEDLGARYVKNERDPPKEKRIEAQSLGQGLDEGTKQKSNGSTGTQITCPNCGTAKGAKGTWCRSAACVARREALRSKGKKSLHRASSTVFQCNEPTYHTPPSIDPEARKRTDPGAPVYGSVKDTGDKSQPADVEIKQRQPKAQLVAPRSPGFTSNASPRDRFYTEVSQLQAAAGTPFLKAPTVGMKTLDLFVLYQEVAARGGMHKVLSKKLWKPIAATLKLPTTCTDYGFRLRRHYERYLLAYEQKHLGTAQKTAANNTNAGKKRKQRSERARGRTEQNKEEWIANPYSKRAYYTQA